MVPWHTTCPSFLRLRVLSWDDHAYTVRGGAGVQDGHVQCAADDPVCGLMLAIQLQQDISLPPACRGTPLNAMQHRIYFVYEQGRSVNTPLLCKSLYEYTLLVAHISLHKRTVKAFRNVSARMLKRPHQCQNSMIQPTLLMSPVVYKGGGICSSYVLLELSLEAFVLFKGRPKKSAERLVSLCCGCDLNQLYGKI